MTKKWLALLLVIAMCVSLFVGCGGEKAEGDAGAESGQEASSGDSGSKDYSGVTFEVLQMVGGQGEMASQVTAKLEEVYPGLKAEVVYDHGAADIMRERTLAGDPPDQFTVNTNWYNHYAAIEEGVMLPFEDTLFDTPSVEDPSKKMSDVIDMSYFGYGVIDGKHYLLPEVMYCGGLWYDANMFKEMGYDVPETWDELIALGDKALADDKKLMLWTTKYGGEYFENYLLAPLVMTLDPAAYEEVQILGEDAYNNPAWSQALGLIKEDLLDTGYADTVSGSLEISETQMEFCSGNVLFYVCGSWLEAEMAGNWPEGFDLQFLPVPPQNAGEPTFSMMACVYGAISADGDQNQLSTDYYRYMLSDPETITKVVETTLNGLPIKGFAENYGHLLANSVKSAYAMLDTPECIPFFDQAMSYPGYIDLNTDMSAAFTSGDMTIDEILAKRKELINSLRDDEGVTKYPFDMSGVYSAIDALK